MLPCSFNIRQLEVVDGKLQFIREAHVAVCCRPFALRVASPYDVVNRIYVLQKSGDALEAIGQLHGNRIQINSAALLEICELRDFEAIEHDLPANTPRAQGG